MYREFLQKMIGFDEWHLSSLNKRPYALSTINRINEMIQNGEVSPGIVLEVGCGLGDIISSIQWRDRLGYDIDKKAILAAKILHPGTPFKVGSFHEIREKKISILIALNFMHQINEKDCCHYLEKLLYYNEVEHIVVDAVQSPPYRYAHDWEALFEKLGGYEVAYKSRGYTAWERSRRKILYFAKTNC